MATVTAAELSLEKTLEELVTEYNNLRSDVSAVTFAGLLTAANSILVFEGATEDAYETSLTVVDPTADRTITLPNVTGTVVTTGNSDAGATTTTFADLDHFLINDGGTLKKMALSTALSSLPALTPASANVNALGSAALEWSDLFLGDGSIISFGNDQEVTLTHVHDTGILLNGAMQLQFSDSSQYINAPSATILDINATDEVELNATLVDVNANLDVSGTALITGVTTHGDAVVSDTDSTDDLGTTGVRWRALYVDAITVTDQITATGFTGTLDGILGSGAAAAANVTNLDASGTIVGASTISGTAITASTSFLPDAQDGAALGTTSLQFSDVFLADGAVIGLGDNNEVTLTHVHDTGILLNSTNVIQFNDASQNIGAPTNAILDINATDEIELNATLVDINANVEISGNLTVSGTTTQVNTVTMNAANAVVFEGATADDFETTLTITDPTADRTITLPDQTGTVHTSGGSIVIPNAANIGSAGDADAIAIASNGVVTFSQIPVLPANSILIANLVDNSITEAKMANDAISSAELKTLSTLLIKNAAGSTLKTLHGAGA
jgi:phage gp45-like